MAPPTKRPKYSDDAMNRALADVALGVPKSTAAKRHGVNRVTLLNKVNGKHRAEQRMGPDAVLSKEEEKILVLWIQSMARVGYPVTRCNLLDSVQQLMKRLGRPNPFSNGRPGKKWYYGFIKRNPSVHDRIAENLTISRARVTKESLLNWYKTIYTFLDSNGYLSALSDPRRVFNSDESAFFLSPKGNRVLAVKGDKNIYQVVNSDEKECLTVLITANAEGEKCPPLIVFKYQRIPQDIVFSVPSDWGIGRSESGWMTSAVFFEFLANIFHPWLLKTNVELPVILFIDGHSSHITLEASEFCEKNKIVLVALHPNATHLIQPLDVSLFKALKCMWKTKVHQWRMDHPDNPCLRKKDFAPLLKEALNEVTTSTISNGFRKCGLVPWDPQKGIKPLEELEPVIYDNRKTKDSKDEKKNQDALTAIEANIPKSTLQLLKQQGKVYSGRLEDASLFELWKTIKSRCASEEQGSAQDRCDGGNYVKNVEVDPDPLQVDNIEYEGIVDNLNSSINNNQTTDEVETLQHNGNTVAENISSIEGSSAPVPGQNRTEANASNDVLATIPSPFKNALIWTPVIKQANKKGNIKNKGIGPGAVSSQEWRQSIMAKEQKKIQAEEAKKKRTELRIQKKMEKEELQKRKKEEKLKKQQMKHEISTAKPILRRRTTKKCTLVSESSTEDEEEWRPSNSESSDEMSNNEPPVGTPFLPFEPQPSPCNLQSTSMQKKTQDMSEQPDEDRTGQSEVDLLEQLEKDQCKQLERSTEQSRELQNDPEHIKDNRHESVQTQSIAEGIEHRNDASYSSPSEATNFNEVKEVDQSLLIAPKIGETFFIACRSSPTHQQRKTLFKIEGLLTEELAIVVPLTPWNRLRTLFVEKEQGEQDLLDLSTTEVTYVSAPVTCGQPGSKKYYFSASLQVD